MMFFSTVSTHWMSLMIHIRYEILSKHDYWTKSEQTGMFDDDYSAWLMTPAGIHIDDHTAQKENSYVLQCITCYIIILAQKNNWKYINSGMFVIIFTTPALIFIKNVSENEVASELLYLDQYTTSMCHVHIWISKS